MVLYLLLVKLSQTAKTASSSAEVNETLLLGDKSLLICETSMLDVDPMSEESLTRLQGKLGIDTMSSKIDYLSEIVEQALTADSLQPCKQKCAHLIQANRSMRVMF